MRRLRPVLPPGSDKPRAGAPGRRRLRCAVLGAQGSDGRGLLRRLRGNPPRAHPHHHDDDGFRHAVRAADGGLCGAWRAELPAGCRRVRSPHAADAARADRVRMDVCRRASRRHHARRRAGQGLSDLRRRRRGFGDRRLPLPRRRFLVGGRHHRALSAQRLRAARYGRAAGEHVFVLFRSPSVRPGARSAQPRLPDGAGRDLRVVPPQLYDLRAHRGGARAELVADADRRDRRRAADCDVLARHRASR